MARVRFDDEDFYSSPTRTYRRCRHSYTETHKVGGKLVARVCLSCDEIL